MSTLSPASLSKPFQETINHTSGAPGSPIRALKLPKLSLMQPYFPQPASIWLFLCHLNLHLYHYTPQVHPIHPKGTMTIWGRCHSSLVERSWSRYEVRPPQYNLNCQGSFWRKWSRTEALFGGFRALMGPQVPWSKWDKTLGRCGFCYTWTPPQNGFSHQQQY